MFKYSFHISLLLFVLFVKQANAQEKYTLSGYVKDAQTGEYIPGVAVFNEQNRSEGITTNIYGFYSLTLKSGNYTISFTSAAHNNPVLISDGNLVEFKADKMPVGKGEKDASFTLFTIEMKDVSDTLYLYTDGYADQFGGTNGKKFKYKQLQQMLLANCDKRLNEQQEIFLKTFNEWKGNLEQVDDVLLIGIRV